MDPKLLGSRDVAPLQRRRIPRPEQVAMAWPGGKDGAGVYQGLINQIPPHDVYVAAFLGDDAIMRRKRPALWNVGIDLDAENVARWADAPPVAPLALHCCCGIQWLAFRFGLHSVPVWYRDAGNGDGRSRMLPAAPTSGPRDLAVQYSAAGNGDGAPPLDSAIPDPAAAPRVFVYVDPPYLMDSRRSAKRLYRQEMTVADHERLLGVVVRLRCAVMVSHYPHPMYARALDGWRTWRYQAATRGGGLAVEQVWCNYPEPTVLHDSRYLGSDKREREKVRRRVRNWTNGLLRMDPLERQAVLDGLRSIEGR